jgi:hypothetical protein
MRSPSPVVRVRGRICAASAVLALLAGTTATAAAPSPQHVAFFTKKVQPLILNKCAAGACHGGATAHEPRLRRGDDSGWIDRGATLANIAALADAVDTQGDPAAFLESITGRHPVAATAGGLTLAPLTARERATLELWLAAARGDAARGGRATSTDAGLAATPPALPRPGPSPPPRPNRFRAILEAAANPLPLPPPQEPQGVILGRDRGE